MLGLFCQPFVYRETSCLAVDQAADFRQVRFFLSARAMSLHANPDRPVDFHPTVHHQMVHLTTFPPVPTGKKHESVTLPAVGDVTEGGELT